MEKIWELKSGPGSHPCTPVSSSPPHNQAVFPRPLQVVSLHSHVVHPTCNKCRNLQASDVPEGCSCSPTQMKVWVLEPGTFNCLIEDACAGNSPCGVCAQARPVEVHGRAAIIADSCAVNVCQVITGEGVFVICSKGQAALQRQQHPKAKAACHTSHAGSQSCLSVESCTSLIDQVHC